MVDQLIVEGPTGTPMRLRPDQAEDYAATYPGGGNVVSPQHAQDLRRQEENRNFAQNELGETGAAALGVAQGFGLNLPGMAAIKLPEMYGDQEQADYARRILEGTGQMGSYKLGEAAGVLLPAAMGDEFGLLGKAGGLSERFASRVLPETAGLLGTAAKGSLKLAARGATEGALINDANEAQQALIYNHPLTFDALAARSLDGALLGGLAGVTVGGIGAVLGHAVTKVGSHIASGIERGAPAVEESVASKYAGVLGDSGVKLSDSPAKVMSAAKRAAEDFDKVRAGVVSRLDRDAAGMAPDSQRVAARLAAEDSDISPKLLKKLEKTPLYEIEPHEFTKPPPIRPTLEPLPEKPVKGEGMDVDVGKKPEARIPLNKKHNPISAAYEAKRLGKELTEFDKRAASGEAASAWNKANDRLHENNLVKWEKEVADVKLRNEKATKDWRAERKAWKEELEASKKKPPVIKHLGDEGGGTWSQWVELRDRLAAGNSSQRAAANIIDSEIRSAMDGAEQRLGEKGLSDQYAHATVSRKLASELANAGTSASKAGRKFITPQELMYGGIWAAKGRVGSALAHAAARQGGKVVEGLMGRGARVAVSPSLGEAVLRNAQAARAAANVRDVSQRIGKIVRVFFGTGRARGANLLLSKNKSPGDYTRAGYDKELSTVQELISDAHMARVNDYAGTDLANVSPDLAKAAVTSYMRAAQYLGTNMPPNRKHQQMNTLRPLPVKSQIDMKEHKFLRISGAVRKPLATLEKMGSGSMSRDEAQAIKSVYPELHSQIIVPAVQNEIMAMKSEGKTMDIGKIAQLGLLLGAPVDRVLEPDYIAECQKALHTPPPSAQDTNSGTSDQSTGNMNSGPIGQAQVQLLTPIDKAVLV